MVEKNTNLVNTLFAIYIDKCLNDITMDTGEGGNRCENASDLYAH